MRYFLFFIIFFFPFLVSGQLTGPGSSAVRYTNYPSSPGTKDPIFIFCNTSGNIKGSLNATSPGGTGPYDFSWYKWNDTTASFSIYLFTHTDVLVSPVNDLEEGGYRVQITDDGGYDTILTSWISLDRPWVQASLLNRTCDYVALKGDTASDIFFYDDPADGAPVRLPNKLKFLWSSDPSSSIPNPDFKLNPQTFDPPLENVTYNLLVTDSMTCTGESSFLYESIHVKADFEAVPDNGEAPLKVSFKDNSIRGYAYRWEFGDDSVRIYFKSELTDSILHTYYIPGEYSVNLTIESELHCMDSLRFNYIVVEPSSMNIPNVFTPDGDGYNDLFTVDSKSIRYLSMEVFSRSGLKVYGFSGDGERLKNWTGWDGNINNSSTQARPGVYFYIIRALGWDNVTYDSKEVRGFVYLYR